MAEFGVYAEVSPTTGGVAESFLASGGDVLIRIVFESAFEGHKLGSCRNLALVAAATDDRIYAVGSMYRGYSILSVVGQEDFEHLDARTFDKARIPPY